MTLTRKAVSAAELIAACCKLRPPAWRTFMLDHKLKSDEQVQIEALIELQHPQPCQVVLHRGPGREVRVECHPAPGQSEDEQPWC